jgi:hypothetical protein
VNGNEVGWTTARTIGLLSAAAALMAVFLVLEARISSPLMPLGLFRLRNVSTANVIGVLMAGGMFAWFFLSALYLQQILGYSPLEVGLASGVVNTPFMMGGAVGLAVLASVAASRTETLEASGDGALVALNGGYHVAFLVGAVFAVAAAAVAGALLRAGATAPAHGGGAGVGEPATAQAE